MSKIFRAPSARGKYISFHIYFPIFGAFGAKNVPNIYHLIYEGGYFKTCSCAAQNIIMIYQNKIAKPPDKNPGIVIISQMMAIPGFLPGGFGILF